MAASSVSFLHASVGKRKNMATETGSCVKRKLIRGQNFGRYCTAINCTSNSKRNTELSFFSFPKDEARSKKWVQNCKREDLNDKSAQDLYKSYSLCALHFETSQFMNATERNKLIWSAVPTIFDLQLGSNYSKRRCIERHASVKQKGCTEVLRPTEMSSFVTSDPEKISACSISLANQDCIWFVGVPVELINRIRQTVVDEWPKKIQDEGDHHGAYEFKLAGNPWACVKEDGVMARNLVTAILSIMATNGWNLVQAADMSKSAFEHDVMFFESAPPDPEVDIFCVSFNKEDRIRVYDSDGMMAKVKDVVKIHWPKGIQQEREYYGARELKLAGYPWLDGEDAVAARYLFCQLLVDMKSRGFKLYGSIDVCSYYTNRELECWYFRKTGPFWS